MRVEAGSPQTPLTFKGSPNPTMGIELELGIVDKNTRALASAAPRLLEEFGDTPHFKAELFQCIVEVVTGICTNVGEARAELEGHLKKLFEYGDANGLAFIGTGTHPFADYRDQQITDNERYHRLVNRMGWPAKRLLIMGAHVHIGIESGEKAIAIMNSLTAYMPHFMAISASSPFFMGNDTGLASSRLKIFENLPTAGLPPHLENWAEFVRLMRTLINAEAIQSIREIWWDVRPHLNYGTLEIRVCDGLATLSEAITVAAFVQALVVHLGEMYDQGMQMPTLMNWTLKENKWRAARYATEARIIRNERGEQVDVVEHLNNLLIELNPIARRLGSEKELLGIQRVLSRGASYSRQRRVFQKTGDLRAVVDSLVEELRHGQQDA
ncbi:MAG: putative glutamate--cysteine ligase 2 [Myxococcota bacterium]|nr:putative glutamate--cysteine ligase 2 [Myxococcota bacterium]